MIIAIDGHSACGKSTLAKDLAREFNFTYIDSGAMYRAVTWYFLSKSIDFSDPEEIAIQLNHIHIHFPESTSSKLYLNNQDVTELIRSPLVSESVSYVAAMSVVRKRLVQLQRDIALNKSVVMDGRDIGSVVFPNADVKFFVTADIETRTQRRFDELTSKGLLVQKEDIKANLLKRDLIDSTRSDSPLIQCPEAYLIDNSRLSRDEQKLIAIAVIKQKMLLS